MKSQKSKFQIPIAEADHEIGDFIFGFFFPDVVKLVDTSDLGSDAVRYGGSSPSIRTKKV
jgi:hypothetical protein